MKTASNVFAVIGMVANIIVAIFQTAFGEYPVAIFIYWILAIVSALFSIAVLVSQEKKVGLGVAAILFVNPLCGIFYLCWDGR